MNSIAENLHAGSILQLGKLNTSSQDTYFAIAKNMSTGSILKLDCELLENITGETIAKFLAKDLKKGARLMLDHSSPTSSCMAFLEEGRMCLDPKN